MTVVQPATCSFAPPCRKSNCTTSVPESRARPRPPAFPKRTCRSELDRVSDIPTAPGSFDARFKLIDDEPDASLDARHGLQDEADARTSRRTPCACRRRRIVTDELDDAEALRLGARKATARTKRRPVTVGKRTDKQVEILEGLTEGDQGPAGSSARIRRSGVRQTEWSVKRSTRSGRSCGWSTRRGTLALRFALRDLRWHPCLWPFGRRRARRPACRWPRPGRSRNRSSRRRREAIEASIHRGIEFLLEAAEQGRLVGLGEHHAAERRLRARARRASRLPAAVTAMCISALIETGGDRPEVGAAIDRGEAWLLEHLPKVRRATPDAFYNNWTHAYCDPGPGADARTAGPTTPNAGKRIRDLIEQQIGMLERYEVVDGGWAYYDFERPHPKAERLDAQLRHGRRAGGVARGQAGGRRNCRSG